MTADRPADVPAGPFCPPPSSRRAEFWVRSLRGWDVTFYLMAAIGALALVVSGAHAHEVVIGVLAIGALVSAYVGLARRGAMTGDRRLTRTYLGVLMVVVVVVVLTNPVGSVLLFIAYSQIWFFTQTRRAGTAACAALTVGVAVALGTQPGLTPRDLANLAAQMAITLVFSIVLGLWVTQVSERSEERAELLERLEATRSELAAAHHAEGVAAERARMAQEIHDTLAQGFASIVMLSQACASDLSRADATAAASHLTLIEESARENLAEARSLVAAFSPVALTGGDLADALERLAQRVAAETGLAIAVDVDRAATGRLGRADEVVLLRAAQEGLTNVRRHAHAGRARVGISQRDGMVRLEVSDDGIGIAASTREGFGLQGMRARVGDAAGTVQVGATDDGGTVLTVDIPAPLPGTNLGTGPGAGPESAGALDDGREEVAR